MYYANCMTIGQFTKWHACYFRFTISLEPFSGMLLTPFNRL